MPTAGTASVIAGVLSLVLLTAVVVLGIVVSGHGRLPGLSRSAVLRLHRALSLLAVAFLAGHVLAAAAVPFGAIPLADAVIPFASARQRDWIGLGSVAADLTVILIGTSLLRRQIGRRAWRAVHWLAYACWPAAIVHSLATGTGMRAGRLLDLALGCVLAVLATVGWRLARAHGGREMRPQAAAHSGRRSRMRT